MFVHMTKITESLVLNVTPRGPSLQKHTLNNQLLEFRWQRGLIGCPGNIKLHARSHTRFSSGCSGGVSGSRTDLQHPGMQHRALNHWFIYTASPHPIILTSLHVESATQEQGRAPANPSCRWYIFQYSLSLEQEWRPARTGAFIFVSFLNQCKIWINLTKSEF